MINETAKDVARELASAENYVAFKKLELALAEAHLEFWACAVREDRPGMEVAEKVADVAMVVLDAHIRQRMVAVFEYQAALEACGDRQEDA